MLTAYFNLNEFDIQNVRLSDKIRIDNSWWNINRIIDYNANSTGPTKVELISIDDNLKIPFVTRDVNILERNSNLLSFIPKLASERAQMINTNLSTSNLLIQGKHNYINDNVIRGNIIGDNNIVNNDSVIFGNDNVINNPNSIVFGSNNIVNNGISNTMIVGDGFTATTGNTLYTNNIIIPTDGTINNISINQVIDGASLFAPSSGIESIVQINTLYPNTATGDYSIAQGSYSSASGSSSYAEGFSTQAIGGASHSEGSYTIASGDSSHAEGSETIASGDYSHSGGNGAISNHLGEWSRCSSYIGNGQYGFLDYTKTTINNTLTEIFLGDFSPNRLTIPVGASYRVKITAIAKSAPTLAIKEWEGSYIISNDSGTIVITPIVVLTTVVVDASMVTTTISLVADTANQALAIKVQGLSVTSVSWYVKLDYIMLF
jgi:hypothetical protein